MRFLTLCVFLPLLISSSLGDDDLNATECYELAVNSGLVTSDFPTIVMHGIHSLAMENLHRYFDDDAPSNVSIPVINYNLSDDAPAVLSSPPVLNLTNPFSSPAMNALDHVLSHMTDNDYDIRNAPPMERVVHALHMLEIWQQAGRHYKKIGKRPRDRKLLKRVCPCLADVENNNILTALKFLAQKIRGRDKIWRYGSPAAYDKFGFPFIPFRPQLMAIRHAEVALATDLTNEAEWEIWKEKMDMREDEASHSKQLAIFIYCALLN